MRGAAGADRRSVSYVHMHVLVELHGQPGWVAALTPLSVDGMIVAASRARRSTLRDVGQLPLPGLTLVEPEPASGLGGRRDLQLQAWHWALSNRAADGSLPSGRQIAHRFGLMSAGEGWSSVQGSVGELGDDDEYAGASGRPQ